MDATLVRLVFDRARNRCEYCQLPKEYDDRPFEIDHTIARKHGGTTDALNLALSCFRCNSYKGSDIASMDYHTHQLTPLFNPRRDRWSIHFRWDGAVLVGRTAIGRVTTTLLHINDELRVQLRRELIEEGIFPGT